MNMQAGRTLYALGGESTLIYRKDVTVWLSGVCLPVCGHL